MRTNTIDTTDVSFQMQLKHNLSLIVIWDPSIPSILIMKRIYQSRGRIFVTIHWVLSALGSQSEISHDCTVALHLKNCWRRYK